MRKPRKKRLDHILVDRHLATSLKEAEILIRAGKVFVQELRSEKPGAPYPADIPIRVTEQRSFVSRGGIKLKGALEHFGISPVGWICADIGASSGGFTDCLLQSGARHVYAIDVAYGQLNWKLRTDSRVTVLERLNVRSVNHEHLPRLLDLAVFDTSFISLIKVIPPILPFLKAPSRILALIKPQFELPKDQVGRGGVVLDENLRIKAVEMVKDFAQTERLSTIGVVASSIRGPKGNQEYLIYLEGQVDD